MNKGFGTVLVNDSASALATTLLAQDQAASPQVATVSNTTAATVNSVATGSDQADDGDIIVTSTRRASRLQGVPLAVDALSGAPKHTVTAGIDFNQPIGERLTLDASATYYYRSAVGYDPGEAHARQPGYDLVGLPFSDPGAIVNWNTRDGRRTIGGQLAVRF